MKPSRRAIVARAATQAAAGIESLEARRLLAAPEILPLQVNEDVPEGRNLYLPVAIDDADGDAVTVTAELVGGTGTNGSVAVLPTGPFVELDVAGFGTMRFQFFDQVAPETVDRLTGLAEAGYYDDLSIFRVIDDFVLQFGDPTENGQNPDPLRPRVYLDRRAEVGTGERKLTAAQVLQALGVR